MRQEIPASQKTQAVLFVCSNNGGKSQLAAGPMKQIAVGRMLDRTGPCPPGDRSR